MLRIGVQNEPGETTWRARLHGARILWQGHEIAVTYCVLYTTGVMAVGRIDERTFRRFDPARWTNET